MPYSSSLSDAEWEILEPLLLEVLPKKKRTRPADWTKREVLDGILYQLKNGCNWEDLPKDLPPYSTVYWHYKQWRSAGVIEQLMSMLHEQVREQVCIQYIDHFGNLVTNIPAADVKGKSWSVAVGTHMIPASQAYSDRNLGDIVALIGSHGWLEVAVNGGSAQSELQLDTGAIARLCNW